MVKNWTDKPVAPDTEGAQLRTGKIKNNNIFLKIGSKIIFSNSGEIGEKMIVPLNIPNPNLSQILISRLRLEAILPL